jgi:hypothetical protein
MKRRNEQALNFASGYMANLGSEPKIPFLSDGLLVLGSMRFSKNDVFLIGEKLRNRESLFSILTCFLGIVTVTRTDNGVFFISNGSRELVLDVNLGAFHSLEFSMR